MQQGSANRAQQAGIRAALAAADTTDAKTAVRFPGEDGGQSLGEMAQRDLDAALQLLADRAQYITGSSGAAIALRRGGRNDMLCRASSGSSAPELGALLSTEFGLSGESVRTRQLLRCDDAERDARVNREACQELGIASVVVMPVVHDDEVMGVFELFSGKAHAFGDRDFAALRRLSEMVETAVKLAQAAEELPQRLKADPPVAEAVESEAIPEVSDPVVEVEEAVAMDSPSVPDPSATPELAAKSAAAGAGQVSDAPAPAAFQAWPAPPEAVAAPPAVTTALGSKPLLWSLAQEARGEATAVGPDQSSVPAMLRNLKKCEACGFPVSAGRMLCVECEEKKWRGQLKIPRQPARAEQVEAPETQRPDKAGPPEGRGLLSASGKSLATPARSASSAAAAAPAVEVGANAVAGQSKIEPAGASESEKDSQPSQMIATGAPTTVAETIAPSRIETSAPELILSAGREPSQSWFGANRFIIITILVIVAAVAAFALLH